MLIIFGIRNFKKNMGYRGKKELCPRCNNFYKRQYFKFPHYIHVMFIPLIPIGSDYYSFCPVCYYGGKYSDDNLAKMEINNPSTESQALSYHAKHYKNNETYDLFLLDEISGVRYDLLTNGSKKDFKRILKNRILKKSDIVIEHI